LVVPEKLKNEILKHCHDDKVAGHLGKDKTGIAAISTHLVN
jgi:hypothetical protein